MDLEGNLRRYLEGTTAEGGRRPDARYSSFDYCFNYFQAFREADAIQDLASGDNLQISCLHLGFYLASWGMLRGSADLLQRSVRHFVPVIEAIATTPAEVWEIDADDYTDAHIGALLDQSKRLRAANGRMSDILVTKVMLGVFGSVPAFDTNFKRGAGVWTFGADALRRVGAFCQENRATLERHRVPTLDFVTGERTERLYTLAKLIDMAFFIEGMSTAA